MAQKLPDQPEKINLKGPFRGVFWDIDGSLLSCPFADGGAYPGAISKSGNTYNHERLWPFVRPNGCNLAYHYFPRGRVEITGRGKAIIYMSPHIPKALIPEICSAFGITSEPKIRFDFNRHYFCHLDQS
jgi:hypothetical protein